MNSKWITDQNENVKLKCLGKKKTGKNISGSRTRQRVLRFDTKYIPTDISTQKKTQFKRKKWVS
jgi:hypothetical protein